MPENKTDEKSTHWEQLETVDVPDVPEELLHAWRKAVATAAPLPSQGDPLARIENRLSAIEATLQEVRGLLFETMKF